MVEPENPTKALADRRSPVVGDHIPSHNPQCFGCGSDNADGLHMKTVVTDTQTVRGRFTVRAPHQGAPGLIHGGVLAAAFDEVLGAVNWLLGTPAVTAKLETNFRQPIPVDEELDVRAWVVSSEGRKAYFAAEATLSDGTVVADATGLFIQVPLAHFAEHGRAQDVAAAKERWTQEGWMGS